MLAFQDGQVFWRDEDFDAAWHGWLPSDEACAFEGKDHLVDRRRGHAEVPLHSASAGGRRCTRVYASMKARYWPCLGVKLGLCPSDI
jgi:hypothetical protein